MIDESVRFLWPAGLALALLVVSIVCLVVSAIAVALRTYLRLIDNVFGIDDALIIGGLVSRTNYYLLYDISRERVHEAVTGMVSR